MVKGSMNYDIIERSICAYCSLFPILVNDVSIAGFSNARYISYLDMVRELLKSSSDQITYDIAIAKQDSAVSNYMFTKDDIMDIMNTAAKYEDKEEKAIHKNLSKSINKLKDRENSNELIKVLTDALHYAKTGNEEVAISTARSLKFNRQVKIKDTVQLMIESTSEDSVFQTGIHEIDTDMKGLCKENIMSIHGDSGSMKTMVSLWMVMQMLIQNPTYKALYFEKEMPPQDIGRRLLTYVTKESLQTVMGWDKFKTIDAISEARDDSQRAHILNAYERLQVIPRNHFRNVVDMHSFIDTEEPNIWCLDFMTQLEPVDKTGDYNQGVMDSANRLKELCGNTNTFGIILNQIGKDRLTRQKCKIPGPDDAEWSGTIKQISAYIFSTFYPNQYYTAGNLGFSRWSYYLIGVKNRHDRCITIPLYADPEHCDFIQPPLSEKLNAIENINKYIKGTKYG